jgi:hypothetical protein
LINYGKYGEDEIIPGAYWRKANGQEDALNIWALAVKDGIVDRI